MLLQDIIIVDNYQNNAFAKTDIMTEYEIQDVSQDLYDNSVKTLEKICEPRYYFKAKLANFVFLKEYEEFTKQLDVGSIITVEVKKGWRTKVVLLSVELDFDNPTNFNMEFSNRHRLDNGIFKFTDLFTDNSRSASSYDWDKMIIGDPIKSGKFTEVDNFIKKNLDASKNALMSAKDIGVLIDGSGIHLRKYIGGVLQPREAWLIDNQFAMSSDNFNTPPRIAIGEFPLPNSAGTGWGVNADFLAGRLFVGNQFIMEAINGSFRFDGSGASLINAIFSVTDKSNIKRTLIDPNNGFKLQGRQNPSSPWEDKIYLDNSGNAVFKGMIEAFSGKLGGIRIGSDGIYNDANGDFWKTNGTGRFGLLSYNYSSATFNGNIYARNLLSGTSYGWVGNEHIANNSISGSKLEASYRDSLASSLAKIEIKADNNSSNISSLTQWKSQAVQSISSISQKTNSNSADISLVVSYAGSGSRRINTASIVASVNNSGSNIYFDADKINFSGFTTFVRPGDLGSYGSTTIDGGRIRTGTIDARYVNVTNLNAGNITAGTISGNRISGGIIDGVVFQWGGSSNSLSMSGSYGIWRSASNISLDANNSLGLLGGRNLSINSQNIAVNGSSQLNLYSNFIRIGDSSGTIYLRGSQVNRNTINYKNWSGSNVSMRVYEWL